MMVRNFKYKFSLYPQLILFIVLYFFLTNNSNSQEPGKIIGIVKSGYISGQIENITYKFENTIFNGNIYNYFNTLYMLPNGNIYGRLAVNKDTNHNSDNWCIHFTLQSIEKNIVYINEAESESNTMGMSIQISSDNDFYFDKSIPFCLQSNTKTNYLKGTFSSPPTSLNDIKFFGYNYNYNHFFEIKNGKVELELELYLDSIKSIINNIDTFSNLKYIGLFTNDSIMFKYQNYNSLAKDSIKIKKDSIVISHKIQPKETEIKKYEQNKTKLKKQIETLKTKINLMNIDSDYSKIDFNKINDAKIDFENLDKKINDASQQELQSVNFLIEDLFTAIKILKHKRKFKKDSLFYKKYENLFINIEELHDYIIKDDYSYNFSNYDKTLICYNDKSVFNLLTNNIVIQSNNNENDCDYGEGYPVQISAVKDSLGHKIQIQNLTVNYDFYLGFNKHPRSYNKLTSPSCEKILPGYYKFWLIDSFRKRRIVSDEKIIDLTKDSKPNKNIIKPIDIPVTN